MQNDHLQVPGTLQDQVNGVQATTGEGCKDSIREAGAELLSRGLLFYGERQHQVHQTGLDVISAAVPCVRGIHW
jgi:hypothetical protein